MPRCDEGGLIAHLKCIFFLTFARTNSIYESRCDFSKSQIRIGESINEERNQEGRREEESCSEEKEVAAQRPLRA
jgi:hypothetical protein